jgi:transposase
MMTEKGSRAAYTLEFKLEATRLLHGGQAKVVTAKILGVRAQTLCNWVRLAAQGKRAGVGIKPVSAEQMELARLSTELAHVKMERDILEEATVYLAKEST